MSPRIESGGGEITTAQVCLTAEEADELRLALTYWSESSARDPDWQIHITDLRGRALSIYIGDPDAPRFIDPFSGRAADAEHPTP